MSKQYLKKLKGTDTPIATRYKPAFSDSEYTGFGELYRNGKWYKDVAVFADDFIDNSNNWTQLGGNNPSTTFLITNNTLTVTALSNYNGVTQTFSNTFEVGKKYRVLYYKQLGSATGADLRDAGSGISELVGTGTESVSGQISFDFIALSTTFTPILRTTSSTGVVTFSKVAVIPLNDDGSIDISGATELTTPQTYLPIEVDVDDQGNLLNVDRMDFPTLVEDYVYAKNVKCDEANFVNGWKSEGMDAYACRAWVNFNGTGTVAIRASGNVSSITDNGTGNYTINFTTAMPDINYAFNASHTSYPGVIGWTFYSPVSESQLNVYTYGNTSITSAVDPSIVTATVFH